MLKVCTLSPVAAVSALMLPVALASSAAAQMVGEAAACRAGIPSIQVRVSGFKQASGTVRVTLYKQAGYLKKGGSLRKVRVPVRSRGPLDICVATFEPGQYSVAVQHDLNGNKDIDRADGGGFSRNPGLSLLGRPNWASTSFNVGSSPRVVPVTLQYLQGVRFTPVGG